jgi:hypothetical protein
MTHSAVHFALGVVVATSFFAPGILHALRRQQKLAPLLRRWLLSSYAVGLWAVVPAILRHVGLPEAACSGWWMNIFLFHPLLSHLHLGGVIIGGFCLALVLALQYGTLLLALWSVRHPGKLAEWL